MSVPRPPEERQPLLPRALEHSLNDLAIRIVGGAFVAFAVTSWLALLSWQLSDPSLQQSSGKAARNLLGPAGANISDMMLQTMGVAVVFALICPMIWGMELLAGVRWLPRFRAKLVAFAGAMLALSGAASGLPTLPGWPLQGGGGGMLGDILYNIAVMAGASIGFDRDGPAVTLALTLLGLALFLRAVGLGLGHLPLPAVLRRPILRATSAAPAPTPAPEAASARPTAPALELPRAQREPELSIRSSAPFIADPLPPIDVGEEGENDSDPEDDNTTLKARAFAQRFAPGVTTGRSNPPARLPSVVKATLARARTAASYRKPNLNLLRRSATDRRADAVDVAAGARTLIEVLAAFGVKGDIGEAHPGPVVTRYELEPVRGTKIARIIGLADDFARELGVHAVRVAVTPGRTAIGIEVPNEVRQIVGLRDVLESDVFTANQALLPLALGKGIGGEPVVVDLARMPHLLVAGTTGSGKSVGIHAMLLSLLYRLDPSELRLLLIDPKMLELSPYERIPHLLTPVITDPEEAAHALDWAVSEMEERYKRMARHSVRSIDAFNARVRSARRTGVGLERTVQTGYDERTGQAIYEREQLDDAPMPMIVIVIDELADLMVTAGRRVEGSVQRLAQKARAAGIHLVMATQRPSVDVVTGTIKANLPARISFRVASKIDSRTILNDVGAEQLLGHGDMLLAAGAGQQLRVHGALVTEDEIERVTEALREQGEPRYVELLAREVPTARAVRASAHVDAPAAGVVEPAPREDLFAAATAVVLDDRKVSAGHLHRRLGVSEDLAAQLIGRMEYEGLVGPVNLFGRRQILAERPAGPAPKARAAA